MLLDWPTEHYRGYEAYGLSKPLPPDASADYAEGYRAHRWEQIARVVAYCVANKPQESDCVDSRAS